MAGCLTSSCTWCAIPSESAWRTAFWLPCLSSCPLQNLCLSPHCPAHDPLCDALTMPPHFPGWQPPRQCSRPYKKHNGSGEAPQTTISLSRPCKKDSDTLAFVRGSWTDCSPDQAWKLNNTWTEAFAKGVSGCTMGAERVRPGAAAGSLAGPGEPGGRAAAPERMSSSVSLEDALAACLRSALPSLLLQPGMACLTLSFSLP